MWSSTSLTASNPYARDSDAYIPNEKVNLQSSNESIADTERNVKVRGTTNSKIPSIFDHVICNSSIIKSYYHFVDVIKKAMISCETTGNIVTDHFTAGSKMVEIGSRAKRGVQDYYL